MIERTFPVGQAPDSIDVDGTTFRRDIAAEHGGFRRSKAKWPILSEAAGVHVKQIDQAREFYRERGVDVDFTSDGRLIMRDREHRRKVLKASGCIDRKSWTGY